MALMTSATSFGLSGWLRRVVIACSNLKFFCCEWLGSGSSVWSELWSASSFAKEKKA